VLLRLSAQAKTHLAISRRISKTMQEESRSLSAYEEMKSLLSASSTPSRRKPSFLSDNFTEPKRDDRAIHYDPCCQYFTVGKLFTKISVDLIKRSLDRILESRGCTRSTACREELYSRQVCSIGKMGLL
jgi:hypothetical protein